MKQTVERLSQTEIVGKEGVGGIPRSIFELKLVEHTNLLTGDPFFERISEGVIDGISGQSKFKYRVTEDRIIIEDSENSDLRFDSWVENGVWKVNVFTKGFQGDLDRTHSDLFAKQLFLFSYGFFKRNGIDIKAFEANWNKQKGKTNFDQYRRNLIRHSLRKPEIAKKKAVFDTWTGRLMQKLGFNRIVSIEGERREYDNGVMKVVFVRSDDEDTIKTLEDLAR